MIDGIPDLVVVVAGVLVSGMAVVAIARITISVSLRYRVRRRINPASPAHHTLPKGDYTSLLRFTLRDLKSINAVLGSKDKQARTAALMELKRVRNRIMHSAPEVLSKLFMDLRGMDTPDRNLLLTFLAQEGPFHGPAKDDISLEMHFELRAEHLSARMPPEYAPFQNEVADAIRDGFRDQTRNDSRWRATQERELRRMWLKSAVRRALAFFPGRRRA